MEFPAETATMQVAREGGCIILQPWEEKNEDRKRFKVCLEWKVNLAYPASFQALHANEKQINIQIEHNKINNPNWQEATSWPSTSVAEHLNL